MARSVASRPRTALFRPQPAAAETTSPWPIFRKHGRSILVSLAVCVAVLVVVELAFFRSGFFISHFTLSNPDFPMGKVALAQRMPDARVLYVGDSTILTGIAPAVITDECRCGPGLNGAFGASNPWLTAAMTRHLLAIEHPALVVIGVSPWTADADAQFADSELAHEVLSPADLTALGQPTDLPTAIEAGLGDVWSAYGERVLLKEWAASLVPHQRYDMEQRGFFAYPGTFTSSAQLLAALGHLTSDLAAEPTQSAPGLSVTGELIDELRARGIAAAIVVPPLHPYAYEQVGATLERADAVIRAFATSHGAELIDCRTSVGPEDFRDLVHLSEAGALKQSRCIGRQIGSVAHR
ncbi:MAG TPA: SGNH/GDSL hydrolase family protein [Candidatus Limnocylindria bacterium]|nr:SGNH/GDSL hydrolase family protein [Candidatus Limnocylindria bacterium]